MSVLCQQEDEITEFAEDFGIPANGCGARLEEDSPQVREDRIFTIRRQLAEGTYDLDERFDAVLDRLLATLCV